MRRKLISDIEPRQGVELEYEISPEEVRTELKNGEPFTLLDVREPWEHAIAHIAGAKLMPMGDVPSRAH
jgi:rhodanese-related sulfurtransferase